MSAHRIHRAFLIASAFVIAIGGCRRGARATDSTPQRVPRDAARFEIESVDDSTARFRPFEAAWVKVGMTATAVDPARRDALVARLRIVRADSGRFVALVTSQVTRVTTDHFLLLVEPRRPWYKERRFWTGVVTGGVVGAGVSGVAR